LARDKAVPIGTVLHEDNAPVEDSGLDPPAKKRAQNSEDAILYLLEDVANPTSQSSLSLTTEGQVQLEVV